MKWIILSVVALGGLALGLWFLFPVVCHDYGHALTKETTFHVDCDFERVRKIMVRTDTSERIVKACDGQIVEKKVESLKLGTDKIFNGNWTVKMQTRLIMKMPDQEGGIVLLPVRQNDEIHPQHLTSTVQLIQPTGRLHDQVITVEMYPHGNTTFVKMRVGVDVRFRAPMWPGIQDMVEKRVSDGIDSALNKMREALIKAVHEYKGQKIYFKF